jgi:hypothetical protein
MFSPICQGDKFRAWRMRVLSGAFVRAGHRKSEPAGQADTVRIGRVTARTAGEREFEGAEALYENLARPDDAAEALERATGMAVTPPFRVCVEEDGTALLVSADACGWSIFAPAGADPDDTALFARKLHGLCGALAEGWDLDR